MTWNGFRFVEPKIKLAQRCHWIRAPAAKPQCAEIPRCSQGLYSGKVPVEEKKGRIGCIAQAMSKRCATPNIEGHEKEPICSRKKTRTGGASTLRNRTARLWTSGLTQLHFVMQDGAFFKRISDGLEAKLGIKWHRVYLSMEVFLFAFAIRT
jgi:hypothetical protein